MTRTDLSPETRDLLARLERGEIRAAARLITRVESGGAEADALRDALLPRCGKAYRVGITGPPGAGKSTLLDRLLLDYRGRGHALGVVAVDPSSPFTGGALLGDRVRMHAAALDPEVFIRSLGSRGSLGGLSRQTEAVVDVLDAFGKDRIFIETLGVGQSELDIVENCFTTVVVLVPESGDGIQTMKAGLMEIGDLFVVNKADREGAERLADELAATISGRGAVEGWLPTVLRCSATTGEGVEAVVEAIEEHRNFLLREGRLSLRRRQTLLRRLREAVETRVGAVLWAEGAREAALQRGVAKLESGQVSFEALVASVLPGDLDALRPPPEDGV